MHTVRVQIEHPPTGEIREIDKTSALGDIFAAKNALSHFITIFWDEHQSQEYVSEWIVRSIECIE